VTSRPPDPSATPFLSSRAAPATPDTGNVLHIDACGMRCPVPLLRLRKVLSRSVPGQVLVLATDDPATIAGIPEAIASLPAHLFAARHEGDRVVFTVLRR